MQTVTAILTQVFRKTFRILSLTGKVAMTPILWMLGFRTTGPAPASVAASWMASGIKTGGSLFSLLQSIAMGGKHSMFCAGVGVLAMVLMWKITS